MTIITSMEQDGENPAQPIAPHGHPGQHEHSSAWTPKQNTSPQENDQFTEGDSLENVALELYVETLLSRAHLLLFNSNHDDINAQENVFDRGKKLLEEAVSMCFSGQYSVRRTLIAKCWYVRGFLADISGDDENTSGCFTQAARLDENYKSLQRVRWHLERQEDFDELFKAWYDAEGPVESRIDGYRLGEPDPDSDAAPTTSFTSANTPNFRHSELYELLLSDINNKALQEDEPMEGNSSPVFPSHQPHHLPPIAAAPYNGLLTDWVDQLVLEKIYGPGAGRQASQETRRALKECENSPVRDLFLKQVEESKKKAEVEAEERMLQILEARTRQSSAHVRRLSGHEALLSDALCITTATAAADDGAGSPRKLTINTQGIRRPSTSSKSSNSSPAASSPLRKASFPGDTQDTADGGSC
ncbi:hypothetical protein AYL99_08203 [Fonsecaea erecta]|uniref:Uncharacterized protein n=1 Tax=Fonsecaea erecta TaxID=1367422 RepID=A0A178ZEH8_9EURO|nr:hypothetical protein AYL99_08203 [Fonsecaea erecta]OAP57465.1 hypothetical protein AYL99_08203 [Fonsecaea erecta]